jgi:hypothetical protein
LESAGTETRANELPNASPENYFRFQTTGQWAVFCPEAAAARGTNDARKLSGIVSVIVPRLPAPAFAAAIDKNLPIV